MREVGKKTGWEKRKKGRERERRSLPDRVSKCTREKRTDENVCV